MSYMMIFRVPSALSSTWHLYAIWINFWNETSNLLRTMRSLQFSSIYLLFYVKGMKRWTFHENPIFCFAILHYNSATNWSGNKRSGMSTQQDIPYSCLFGNDNDMYKLLSLLHSQLLIWKLWCIGHFTTP